MPNMNSSPANGAGSSQTPGSHSDPNEPTRKRKRDRDQREHFKDVVRIVLNDIKLRKMISEFLHVPRDQLGNKLCDVCTRLNLTRDKFIVEQRSRARPDSRNSNGAQVSRTGDATAPGRVSLGRLTALRLKRWHCPFCRLITSSLVEQPSARLVDVVSTRRTGKGSHDMEAICYASWVADGRESVSDEHGNVTNLPRTKRLRLNWSDDKFQEAYIVLVAPTWTFDSMFLGRVIETHQASGTKHLQKLVGQWLALCCSKHGAACSTSHGKEFNKLTEEGSFFGVIDVENMCLSPLPKDSKYVALSYTWGDERLFTTATENIADLRKKEGISKVFDQLPRTIQDTIHLVQDLGIKSWDLNAKFMDLVYGNSELTVCAADGEGAFSGLKALDPSQRYAQQYIERYSQGVELMVSYVAETYVNKSKWNTRAWTFQERLLSKRCLIFTGGRVYFQCGMTTMSEDIHGEPNDAGTAGWSVELVDAPLCMFRGVEEQPLAVYATSVPLYTSRDLGRPQDILAAFNGIGNVICKSLGGDSVFGLPSSHFDYALLWESTDAPRRRMRPSAGASPPPESEFPSWSWCGWTDTRMEFKGHMVYGCKENLHEWLMEHTWINWYIRDDSGSLRVVWDGVVHSHVNEKAARRWQGYGLGTQHGQHGSFRYGKSYDEFDRYGRPIRRTTPRSDVFYRTLPEHPFGVPMVKEGTAKDPNLPDQRYLQFWTWSARFRITPETPENPFSSSQKNGFKCRRYAIEDRTGTFCGTIVLDRSWDEDSKLETPHEFIAISDAKNFASEEYNDWAYYIQKARNASEWDLYYVLLIQHRGEIAETVGLGKVFKEAFENSCDEVKSWKEIILG